MSLSELYQLYRLGDANTAGALELLRQTNWFDRNSHFDPKTGGALPLPLSAFLAKCRETSADGVVRDRLWRIVEHSRASVERLFRSLNESPRREHALLPIHAVRELDASSFIKLSNRPGRNIREKLAGKPYLQAVKRFQSVDLPENRLLKAFAIHLVEMLELRRDCLGLGEQEDELLGKIQLWLRSDVAKGIGSWGNPPPNNTLLSHRDYRRVWDAWRWMQTLDEDITRDFNEFERREKTMCQWTEYGRMYLEGTHRFAEMPVLFDYDKFEIKPWLPQLSIQKADTKIGRTFGSKEISEPVCIDLTVLHPHFSTGTRDLQKLPESYLWQHWRSANESVDLALFASDAIYLHPDAESVSMADLFFSQDKTKEHFDRAAHAFANKLRNDFRNDKFIWLVPDFINDFELEVIRRNLNAHFPAAEPLPRSVAAVFQKFAFCNIKHDSFTVVAVDNVGGTICATKLIARFDADLKIRVPETKGFYWERCPPIIITKPDAGKDMLFDMVTVDGNGEWHNSASPDLTQSVNGTLLKSDPRIGTYDSLLPLSDTDNIVAGGIRLHALQVQAGKIPLWRDQIPELSIEVKNDVRIQRFYLVSRGTTVRPIRGLAGQKIKVEERFTLQAGRPHYQFPLFLGENADSLGYSARLESTAFPLKEKVTCKLDLTFDYGSDEPYSLVFTPCDKSFPPARVTWRKTEEVCDAPAPRFPTPMTWQDLRRVPKPGSSETSDLLDWVERSIARIDRDLYFYPKLRITGVISNVWRTDRNGGHFTYVTCEDHPGFVFIHEKAFVRGLNFADFTEGMEISFELQERDGKYSGAKAAEPSYQETKCLKDFDEESARSFILQIRNSLYFPVIKIWSDGRSISDLECPEAFASIMTSNVAYLAALLRERKLPENAKGEIRFLLSCMHKDTPDEVVKWIEGQVTNEEICDNQAIGFALGDVSKQWQKDAFSKLARNPTYGALSVFAYAIWRESSISDRFQLSELRALLPVLLKRLEGIISAAKPDLRDSSIRGKWTRATTETLELLLGLLRTRDSSNPEIKMLLQPNQKITKELAKQVERVTDMVSKANVPLRSRLMINIQNFEADRPTDLLYALHIYLTGEDDANAIHIEGVSDNE